MKANFHTHTVFCDGTDTPEQLVLAALDRGFDALGFSGHGETPFDHSYCMNSISARRYRSEIAALRTRYAGQISLFCGVEQDYCAGAPTTGYDYMIGSVHYLMIGDTYLPVDENPALLRQGADRYFGGDFYALVEAYYRAVADVAERMGADLIGHFDLIAKFNEGGQLFDEQHLRYRAAAFSAAEALLKSGKPFELNTGAMARGLRSVPYPAPFLAEWIAARGGKLVLSSDCHDHAALDFGFEETLSRAQAEGWATAVSGDGFLSMLESRRR
ncbi:MAG: histidinol-phosphatase HisJ family protein [Clostridiaceae bacterium]|nr:histidinol-phosphatase HisJ family protein [Clostridiaceae bacterium]